MSAPSFSPTLHKSTHLFRPFLSSGQFDREIEILNEDDYSLLSLSYFLQQHTLLAFCNDFELHYRMMHMLFSKGKQFYYFDGVMGEFVPFFTIAWSWLLQTPIL